jgi:hypothetical protein
MKKQRKPWKIVKLNENNTIDIYGNNHDIELQYDIPEWNKDDEDPYLEQCFKYHGHTYFLSEFMNIHNKVYNPCPSKWMLEFNGILNDSYFSGILIKLSEDGETVRAYTFIS